MTSSQNNGRTFVDFMKIEEQAIYTHQPLGGSFAVIEHDSHFLLCYNIWRCQWEIPAGKREENETPKECAARELFEETGQRVDELQFVGLSNLILFARLPSNITLSIMDRPIN